MIRLLTTLRAMWQSAREDVAYDAFEASQYDEGAPTAAQQTAEALAIFARACWAALHCWARGHVVECDAVVGPDSASEDHYCSRCGRGLLSITYY